MLVLHVEPPIKEGAGAREQKREHERADQQIERLQNGRERVAVDFLMQPRPTTSFSITTAYMLFSAVSVSRRCVTCPSARKFGFQLNDHGGRSRHRDGGQHDRRPSVGTFSTSCSTIRTRSEGQSRLPRCSTESGTDYDESSANRAGCRVRTGAGRAQRRAAAARQRRLRTSITPEARHRRQSGRSPHSRRCAASARHAIATRRTSPAATSARPAQKMASGESGQAGRNENAEFIVMGSPSQQSADDAHEP